MHRDVNIGLGLFRAAKRHATGCTPRGGLSLYGLRRGEVLGLRWSDMDLKAKTLTVNQARVLVEYRVRIEEPKSQNGKRTLPLGGELVAALTLLRKLQMEESHYDSAFTQKTYVHTSDDDLQQGRTALAKIHKIA